MNRPLCRNDVWQQLFATQTHATSVSMPIIQSFITYRNMWPGLTIESMFSTLHTTLWVHIINVSTMIIVTDQQDIQSSVAITQCNICDSLQWRHNERGGVWNHQPHDCLHNCLFWCRSKKTSKLRFTDLCEGNSPVTGEFPSQRASNAENVSIWWRHHILIEMQGHQQNTKPLPQKSQKAYVAKLLKKIDRVRTTQHMQIIIFGRHGVNAWMKMNRQIYKILQTIWEPSWNILLIWLVCYFRGHLRRLQAVDKI